MTDENKIDPTLLPESEAEAVVETTAVVTEAEPVVEEVLAAETLPETVEEPVVDEPVVEEVIVEEVVVEVELPPVPTVGQRLREAREAAGLSVSDIAQRFKLGIAQVVAVEADAWDKLPGRTFARGVVRGYAREMRLDVEALVAQVMPVVKAEDVAIVPASTPTQSAPTVQPSRPTRDIAVVVLGGVLLVIAILIYFLWPDMVKPEAGLLPASNVEAPAAATPPSSQGENSQLLPPTVVTLNTLPTPPVAEPVVSPIIKISFAGSSWVEVRDKSGNAILSLTGNAGLEKEVTGQPPFAIHIGNVGGVKLQYKGQAVDLQPFTTNNIGRVKLD